MAEHDLGQGVRVRAPDDVEVRVVLGAVKRGARRASPSAAPATDELKLALNAAGLVVASEIALAPKRSNTRALRSGRTGGPEIEVSVGPAESALVLVEGSGGVYAWAYPKAEARRPKGRRGAPRTLVFSLSPPASPSASRGAPVPSGRRGILLDWIGDKLVEPVRAYVLKFAVNAIVDVAVDFLEGDKHEGLIAMADDDAAAWRPGGAVLSALPADRPAKILLMVHGTFSSTAGGFGHLLLSEGGRGFLARARAKYDAILAFDHKTLEVDPKANATALMDALEKFGVPKDSSIDAVAHSRGGLVYRVFAEQLLAKRRPDIKLGKAVFVGCTNGGTHLAEPENWAAMLDLYTNAIMAGARAVVSLAGGGVLSPLVSTGIKTVGRFVQMFSEVAITDMRVPGLAAMQPTSATVKSLNDAQGGLDRLATYYAITSSFAARLEPRNGITKEFAEFVLDRVTDRLFKVDNDLVVDTESMITLGTRKGRLDAGEVFAFGNTDDIYHTIYFAADRVPMQLGEWLELPSPLPMDGSLPNVEGSKSSSEDSLFEAMPMPMPVPERVSRGDRSRFSLGDDEPKSAGDGEPTARPSRRSGGLESFRPSGTRSRARPPKAAVAPPTPESATSESAPAATKVPCHFAAEMEPFPPLKKRVPLFVTISREKIEVLDSAASKATEQPVVLDASRKIEVEVIALKNCRVIGEAKVEVDVPDQKHPEALRFAIEGVEKGAADILVEARQGARILVSFQLAPVFVETDGKPLKVSQSASAAPDGAEEPAVLRIYEIVENGRVTLRFDLTCSEPRFSVYESRTLPAGFSRDAYVAANFKEIENAWVSNKVTHDQFLQRLQDNGAVMANELLPDRVRAALWQHRDEIRAIQVISEEPFIPWELLYVTDPKSGPEGKGFLCEWGLVRWLHNTRSPGRRLALKQDRVRYVIPTYVDPSLTLDGADDERNMLKAIFPSAQPVNADSISVGRFLQTDAANCDVLHFACHGEAAQRAVMTADLLMNGSKADGGYVTDLLSSNTVKTRTRFAATGPAPIVFINACQTGRAGAGLAGVAGFVDAFLRPFTENGAGAVVGALWSVDDKLAFTFAETFYGALQSGKTLAEAARAARQACKGDGNGSDFTWLAYSVYGDPFARVT